MHISAKSCTCRSSSSSVLTSGIAAQPARLPGDLAGEVGTRGLEAEPAAPRPSLRPPRHLPRAVLPACAHPVRRRPHALLAPHRPPPSGFSPKQLRGKSTLSPQDATNRQWARPSAPSPTPSPGLQPASPQRPSLLTSQADRQRDDTPQRLSPAGLAPKHRARPRPEPGLPTPRAQSPAPAPESATLPLANGAPAAPHVTVARWRHSRSARCLLPGP